MLTGLIFDDRGNPMSPSHANKKGVRYRYYVSHALLQNRKDASGSIARVSAPDVEALVCEAVRQEEPSDSTIADRELLQRHIERVTVRPKELEIMLRSDEDGAEAGAPTCLSIPFVPNLPRQKGIIHAPANQGNIDAEARDALLRAIARARGWLDAILSGKAASFDDIAAAENLAERHVQFLMPSGVPVSAHHQRHRRWRGPGRPHRIRPRPRPATQMDRPGANVRTGLERPIRSRYFIFRQIAARGSPPHRSDGPGYGPERLRPHAGRQPNDCELTNRTGLVAKSNRSPVGPVRKFRRLEIARSETGA